MDANKTAGEEAKRQLRKNAASNIQQVLAQTPQHTNYTATCLPSRKLSKLDELDMQDTVEKQGRAHKRCTPMDPHI